MATADQLKALIESFGKGDDDRFIRIALQLAAHEARRGHTKVARELRDAIDAAQARAATQNTQRPVPITTPRGELEGVLSVSYPETRLSGMILSSTINDTLQRLLKEHRHRHRLREHGLEPRRKLMLVGPPGTGKTMTARALAGELKQPLFVVQLDSLMSRYMGETAAKLRLVFNSIQQHTGVYLFDEFDAIGSQRARNDDVGEVRRVLNSFLQFIEEDRSESLIIAATNHPEILDYALFRRFDDVIRYELPDSKQAIDTIRNYLATFPTPHVQWEQLAPIATGLSHAELRRSCEDAAKDMLLDDKAEITTDNLIQCLRVRLSSTAFP